MFDWSSEEVQAREVRLFPTIRISTEREAELRATASLCAMIRAVSEFGRAVVKMAEGPAGRLSCYTEVSFAPQDPDAVELRPDAVIRVVRGKKEWTALVEVKVGDTLLREDQVTDYHKLVRQEGFDALITISNQTASPDGTPPVPLDKRRLRTSPVFQISWDRLLSEAQLLSRKKGINDEDQQWMLDEWIKYVADPNSKIIAPPELGEHWHKILQSAREGNMTACSREVTSTVGFWDSFLKKVGLRLRAKLGVNVEQKLARADRQDPDARLKRLHAEVMKSSCLVGELKIPDAIGDVTISLNLQARTVRFSVAFRAPSEGRNQTRINWLVRQLKSTDAPKDVVVKVLWDQRQPDTSGRLESVLADATVLLRSPDGRPITNDVTPKRFSLEWTSGIQKGRGRSTARVLDGIAADLERFYRSVMETLVPFVPTAPRLPRNAAQAEQVVPVPGTELAYQREDVASQSAASNTDHLESASSIPTRTDQASGPDANEDETMENV